MSIRSSLRKEIGKATRLIDTGRESYVSLSKKFNVEMKTIYVIHHEWLAREELRDLEEEIRNRKEERARLEGDFQKLRSEIKGLKQEAAMIKEVFKAQGLNWDEGVKMIVDVRDLRAERVKLTGELTKVKTSLKKEETKLSVVKRITKSQQRSRETLRRDISKMSDRYYSYKNWLDYNAPKIWQYHLKLKETTKKIEEEKRRREIELSQLQEKLKRLEATEEELSTNVKNLETTEEKTKEAYRKMIEDAKLKRDELLKEAVEKSKRIVGDAEEKAKKILEDAEQKRDLRLAGVQGERERIQEKNENLKRENKRLEGENELMKLALKGSIEDLLEKYPSLLKREEEKRRKQPREISSSEEFSALEKGAPNGNVEALMKLASIEKSLDRIEERRREMRRKSL